METLIKLGCLAANGPPHLLALRSAGLRALDCLLHLFRATPDPTMPGTPLLALYAAQITSVLRQTLTLTRRRLPLNVVLGAAHQW